MRKNAFTMAEVLITLGIIGVVAVLTMPTLINAHQKQVLVNQLKKSYSIIQQAVQQSMTDDNATYFSETRLARACFFKVGPTESGVGGGFGDKSSKFVNCPSLLRQYFAINNISTVNRLQLEVLSCTGSGSNLSCAGARQQIATDILINPRVDVKAVLKDSSILYLGGDSYSDQVYTPKVLVDVNGVKAPNLIGRDIFMFDINRQTGDVVPSNPSSFSLLPNAQTIIDAGWKMNY